MTLLLMVGIGVILAGVAAVTFGIPVKEFGFGNTLILTGTVGACTGLIIVSMAVALRELKKLAPGFAAADPELARQAPRRALPPLDDDIGDDDEHDTAPARDAPLFSRDQAATPRVAPPEPGVPPWQDEVLRDRERLAAAAAADAAEAEPKRRNLLFSSSRRERTDGMREQADLAPVGTPEDEPVADDPLFPSKGFADAWQQTERPRADAFRRAARAPAVFADRIPDAGLIPDRDEPAVPARMPGVTVLKAGVVDGMAYSLYSDGSIEAQMPEGMMRFASIDDLRQHLDNRG